MFSNQVLGLIFPTVDQVFVEIGIENTQPIEAIILQSKNLKATLNDMPHLKKFVQKVNSEPLQKVGLTLMGESEESAKTVFTSQVQEILAKYSDAIHMIHFTDQQCYSPYPNVLKVTLNIGETKESLDLAAKFFGILLNQFIDPIATAKLSEAGLVVSKKNREADERKKAAERQKQLEEEAQKKKDEKDKLEREKAAKLSPAERAKWEEKQKKKELKNQSKKQVKVMKF